VIAGGIGPIEASGELQKGEKAMTGENGQHKKGWEASGVFVPAGILIGMGVGFLVEHLVTGLFIGLGAGLLLMAVARIAFDK
jgi:hypothetical protein